VGLIKGDEEIECVRKAVKEDDSLSEFWISLLLRLALCEELDAVISGPECQACWYTIAIEDALKAGSYGRVIAFYSELWKGSGELRCGIYTYMMFRSRQVEMILLVNLLSNMLRKVPSAILRCLKN
jgi:hypothetical protein